jgi:hypothetical protein
MNESVFIKVDAAAINVRDVASIERYSILEPSDQTSTKKYSRREYTLLRVAGREQPFMVLMPYSDFVVFFARMLEAKTGVYDIPSDGNTDEEGS